MDKALARASVTIELVEDINQYEAQITSTNGTMLQPYDTSTTLIGTVLKNKVDITRTLTNVKWTKWNPSADDLIECPEWNERHKGESIIQVSKDDVDNKSIFMFEAYNNRDELLCSSSISIIDINDLLVSTKEPKDPYVGQLWIDDREEPATIYVWNGYKWVVSGTVGAIAKNLLRNTNFFIDCKYWDIVGDKRNMYTPTPIEYLSHKFLKMNSNVMTDDTRGITQTTIDTINKNSEYSFQMLYYSKTNDETFSNNITVNIYSIESNGEETIVYTTVLTAETKLQQLYARFKSTQHTEAFKVEILGEDTWRFNFCIGELALYNTWNNYPWTINPIDMNITNYTQEDLWNILSNNGTVQGIFSQTNPETGQLDYYINASLITAGKLLAQYMDLYNLKVLRKDNPELPPTLEIDENGKVIIRSDDIQMSSGESILEMANNVVRLGVDSEGKQSFFTIDQDSIVVESQNISLYGYTTINRYFIIHEDGTLEANDAKFNGTIIGSTIKSHEENPTFTLEPDGTITGSTIRGSLVEGTTVKGGTIIATNIYSEELYDEDGNELLGDNGLPIEPKFKLTSDGVLTANEAEIRGRISGEVLSGETFVSASGKFSVDADGKLHATEASFKGSVTSEGTISGSTLIGSTIQNKEKWNESTFTVDSEGTVTGATLQGGSIGIGLDKEGKEYSAFTVDIDGNCNISRGQITIGDNFKVTNSGDLTAVNAKFTGEITSDSIIRGAKIIAPFIQSGETLENSSFYLDNKGNIKGANLYGGSISIGQIGTTDEYNFTVDQYGNMIANKGTFTGDIKSGSKITGSSIYSNDGSFSISEAGEIKGGSINIKDKFIVTPDGKMTTIDGSFKGQIDCGDGKFVVTNDGVMSATGATITGTITAEQGKIAGYEIEGNKLVGESVGLSGLNGEGLAFWAGSNTPGEAPFRVDHYGKLFADGATISGTVSGSDIIGGSIKIGPIGTTNNYSFYVDESGKTEIGGKGIQTIDGESRSPIEITPDGVLYSTNSIKGIYTKISAGKIECKGLNGNQTIIEEGAISAVNGNFKGTISSSDIEASTFTGNDDLFKVTSDGTVEAKDLVVNEEMSATTISASSLNISWYDRALTRDVDVYINKDSTAYSTLTESYFDDNTVFKTFNDLMEVCPRNLNGYTLNINLQTDIGTSDSPVNLWIDGFNNGRVNINMQGNTIYGYLAISALSGRYYLYGNTSDSTGGSTRGKIRPAFGYKYFDYRFGIYCSAPRLNITDVDIYNGSSTTDPDTNKTDTSRTYKCITTSGGCISFLADIAAVNNPTSLIRAYGASHIYVSSSSGTTTTSTFQAISGSIININTTYQAYRSDGKSSTFELYNGKIFSEGALFKANPGTGDSTPTPDSSTNTTTTTTTKTITYKSSSGASYRNSGSYKGTWATSIVRQGQWTSGYGHNTGMWFFGDNIYNILQKYEVTSIKLTFSRQSGGYGQNVSHYLMAHKYSSRPGSPSSSNMITGVYTKTGVNAGTTVSITLSGSTITTLKNNGIKGFGLYTSSTSQTAYSCCSPSCSVTITYKVTS